MENMANTKQENVVTENYKQSSEQKKNFVGEMKTNN